MYPELFKIGPFTVYSYGLMLGLAFIAASYLLTRELKRRQMNPNLATEITLLALIFGIVGSKGLFLIENWELFLRAPLKMALSPGGLTWYGGFALAVAAIYSYLRRKKISFLLLCDLTAPGLALGYGIARIGCHLSGDGDYGIPTSLPWGTVYAKGIYPPSLAFQKFPEIANNYPGGIVPDTTPLHPAPIYELLASIVIFIVLWKMRKQIHPTGKLFMVYLILSALERFLVEFIRLNPRILFGLTEAQLVSIVLVLVALYGIYYLNKRESIKKKPKFA
jgi:phosphatidylglycerol:prolipoprotein diacylglycerol transferase